jgi:hypothetical protein
MLRVFVPKRRFESGTQCPRTGSSGEGGATIVLKFARIRFAGAELPEKGARRFEAAELA